MKRILSNTSFSNIVGLGFSFPEVEDIIDVQPGSNEEYFFLDKLKSIVVKSVSYVCGSNNNIDIDDFNLMHR